MYGKTVFSRVSLVGKKSIDRPTPKLHAPLERIVRMSRHKFFALRSAIINVNIKCAFVSGENDVYYSLEVMTFNEARNYRPKVVNA